MAGGAPRGAAPLHTPAALHLGRSKRAGRLSHAAPSGWRAQRVRSAAARRVHGARSQRGAAAAQRTDRRPTMPSSDSAAAMADGTADARGRRPAARPSCQRLQPRSKPPQRFGSARVVAMRNAQTPRDFLSRAAHAGDATGHVYSRLRARAARQSRLEVLWRARDSLRRGVHDARVEEQHQHAHGARADAAHRAEAQPRQRKGRHRGADDAASGI